MMSAHANRCAWFGGKRGIHLRPAAEIAPVAGRFPCVIAVRCGDKTADARSVFDLLLLAAAEGAELTLEASGPECDAARDALGEVFANEGLSGPDSRDTQGRANGAHVHGGSQCS